MEPWKDKLRGNWNQIKGNIKQKYADLTDDDLLYVEGKEDELVGRLQKKTGETKETVQSWFNSDRDSDTDYNRNRSGRTFDRDNDL
jgi:uncharacterized protein YjbJ (UPF0337 family)